jgi:hypothetical protein
MRRPLVLLVVLSTLGLLSACSSHDGPSPSEEVGGTVVVKQSDNGTALHVQPKDRLRFELGGATSWRVVSYPRDIMRLTKPPTGGRFELQLHGVGAGKVRAVGTRTCHGSPGCPKKAAVFWVMVYAQWIP